MHLRIWCIERLENMVLAAAACAVSQRAAHGIRAAAARRDRGPQPSMRARCHSVRSPGFDLHRGRCRHPDRGLHPNDEVVGASLHVGPVHLESGCKIGMRAAVANNVTVGRGTWITPFTPILGRRGSA